MDAIKYIRLQVDGHTIVEFRNGARACSCGLERGVMPNLRELAIDAAHIERQRAWSRTTFGPGIRLGVLDHIRKELTEVAEDPTVLEEWVDVIILAFDGAWRAGHEPQQIIDAVKAKQAKNEARTWPDWRTADRDKAIEHDRTSEGGRVADKSETHRVSPGPEGHAGSRERLDPLAATPEKDAPACGCPPDECREAGALGCYFGIPPETSAE